MRQVYRLAAYFREWNVEGENGFLRRLTLEQFWAWMEFNRLNPFLEERDDLRLAQIASLVHNANVIEKSDLKSPGDFMLPSIDEMIQKERERKEANDAQENIDPATAQAIWKENLKHLMRGKKPVETTVKG